MFYDFGGGEQKTNIKTEGKTNWAGQDTDEGWVHVEAATPVRVGELRRRATVRASGRKDWATPGKGTASEKSDGRRREKQTWRA